MQKLFQFLNDFAHPTNPPPHVFVWWVAATALKSFGLSQEMHCEGRCKSSCRWVFRPLHMDCFGIGTTRLLAASVEVLSSNDKVQWPRLLAPYQICIIPQTVCCEFCLFGYYVFTLCFSEVRHGVLCKIKLKVVDALQNRIVFKWHF